MEMISRSRVLPLAKKGVQIPPKLRLEDTMITDGAALSLREEREGPIGIGIAKDTDPPATTARVEVALGADAHIVVLAAEANEEIGHRTMEVRQAEKSYWRG